MKSKKILVLCQSLRCQLIIHLTKKLHLEYTRNMMAITKKFNGWRESEMFSYMRINRILWILLACLSLLAASVGLLFPDIYALVVDVEMIPGVISQDLVTIISAIGIIGIALTIDRFEAKGQMIALGIMGYLFYAYGIYVIEQIYTGMYLVYMAIFGLSFYSIAYCAININRETISRIKVPRSAQLAAAVYLLINAIMFNIIWISQLIPLIQTATKLEFMYSIYILDLCFIMPLFIITAVMAVKNNGFGLSVAPSLLVLGFLVLIPLAVTEISKPIFFGLPMVMEGIVLFLPLAIIFLGLAVFYLWNMEIN